MKLVIFVLQLLRGWPLPLLRTVGTGFGYILWALLARRRHVVLVNLQLCFPNLSAQERDRWVRQVFIYFAQSFLDRAWLWHGHDIVLRQRLRLMGAVEELQGNAPTVLFAPHFVGMDVGWLAMNFLTPENRNYAGIYAEQTNKAMTDWIRVGRSRHNKGRALPTQVSNKDGVRGVLKAIQSGSPLYVLPDLNYEPNDSLYIPFFGIPSATLPILARYAKLGGKNGVPAKVVPIVTRMTSKGYDIEIHPAWQNYPSGSAPANLEADTRRMNQELEQWIRTMPAQYYWVHRRFKDQPNGQASPYKND